MGYQRRVHGVENVKIVRITKPDSQFKD